jgi:sigma-B regulation protein RsbU (phosphoserine phosphatase)
MKATGDCIGSIASVMRHVSYPFPPASIAENSGGRGAYPPPRRRPATSGSRIEMRRMQEELTLAAAIQARLFPAVLPELLGCELAARNRPALLCGGDYYDVLPTTGAGKTEPHLLCVADVAGKGLPASLLMSNLQAILHTSLWYRPGLADLVVRTNELLNCSFPPDRYVTAILADFEPVTGTCTFVNAGHNGGVLMRADGRLDVLKPTGPPLGILQNLPFLSERTELLPGDVLYLYSDGVPEAFNRRDEEWGDERLMSCLHRCRDLSPEKIISEVFEEIDTFVSDAPQHDDITMLVLKRKK